MQQAVGEDVAAVGIGAINDRMKLDRIESELLPVLREEAGLLADKFTILEKEGLL